MGEFGLSCKIEIKSVFMKKPSLEDVFLLFTGRTIREGEKKERGEKVSRLSPLS